MTNYQTDVTETTVVCFIKSLIINTLIMKFLQINKSKIWDPEAPKPDPKTVREDHRQCQRHGPDRYKNKNEAQVILLQLNVKKRTFYVCMFLF